MHGDMFHAAENLSLPMAHHCRIAEKFKQQRDALAERFQLSS